MSPVHDMEVTLNSLVEHPESERLRDFDVLLDEWIHMILEDVARLFPRTGDLDTAFVERFRETARQLSKRLNEELPPALEAEAVAEARGIIVDALHDLDDVEETRPWDTVEVFVLKTEAIRHIVRDALDGHVGSDGEDAGALARTLQEWLPRVTQREQARLVDISPRQLQRWKRAGGEPTRRLLLVVQLVALLRRAWTPEGIVAWFDRERRDLDGERPMDVLDDPRYERRLLTAVRQGRAEHGA